MATYTTAGGSLYRQVALLALLFFLVSIPCVGAWAALGAGASRFLMTPRRLRLFNVVMALLLVASLVPLLRTRRRPSSPSASPRPAPATGHGRRTSKSMRLAARGRT